MTEILHILSLNDTPKYEHDGYSNTLDQTRSWRRKRSDIFIVAAEILIIYQIASDVFDIRLAIFMIINRYNMYNV